MVEVRDEMVHCPRGAAAFRILSWKISMEPKTVNWRLGAVYFQIRCFLHHEKHHVHFT